MTSLKPVKVLNSLKRKGFCQGKGDHKHLTFYVNGKKTNIRTKVSHGSKEISGYLIHLMSIQTKLEKKQFLDLIACPMSSEDYEKDLRRRGVLVYK